MLTARIISAIFLSLSLQNVLVDAHSFIKCTDLVAPPAKTCKAYARNFNVYDIAGDGYTYRPGQSGVVCDPANQARQNPVSKNYSPQYPMAQAFPGQNLTIAWWGRNHADLSQLPNMPGINSYVYGYPVGDPAADPSETEINKKLVAKLKFNNCDFSQDSPNDRHCWGTVPVDSTYVVGKTYTYQWWWEFNAGEFYATCFDVLIVPPKITPTATPSPSPSPSKEPTRRRRTHTPMDTSTGSSSTSSAPAVLTKRPTRTKTPTASPTATPSPSPVPFTPTPTALLPGSEPCQVSVSIGYPWQENGAYINTMNAAVKRLNGDTIKAPWKLQLAGKYSSAKNWWNSSPDSSAPSGMISVTSGANSWQDLASSAVSIGGQVTISGTAQRSDFYATEAYINGMRCQLANSLSKSLRLGPPTTHKPQTPISHKLKL